mmetsp:Transcript_26808/g.76928  ORF Transcript_26808/g.76928 Transcript_26808/m.76928 type:complete len:263 (-) Transcript_26808:34-822(-)
MHSPHAQGRPFCVCCASSCTVAEWRHPAVPQRREMGRYSRVAIHQGADTVAEGCDIRWLRCPSGCGSHCQAAEITESQAGGTHTPSYGGQRRNRTRHEKALEAERSKVRLLESQMHTLAAELEAQRDRVKDFDQLKSKYDKVVADMARVSEEKALADKQIQELVDRIKVAEEHAAQAAAESKQMRDKVAGVKVTGVQEHVNNDVPAVPASRTDIYDWVNLYKKDQLIHFAKVYGVDTRKGQTKMAIVDEIAKAIYSPTTGDE